MHDIPFLELSRQHQELSGQLEAAVLRVLRAGWYILGPEVQAFETEWAAYCGVAHCVGMGNGLQALELTLRAWDVGTGDEVIVPSNTYIASWLAVSAVGATPVPVEPRIGTSTIDAAQIRAAMTSHTRVVMPVHLYGQCADMQPIMHVARERGVKVLEDAAQAHGATYRGRRAGALGDAAAFSFYPTKNLGAAGDGGAVTTDDEVLARRLRLLRNYGSAEKYIHEERGTNSRLDELQAAILRVRLRHLDDWNLRRQRVATAYLDELADLPWITLPTVASFGSPAWHVFVIRVAERDQLQQRLARGGVGTLVFYPVPPHLSGAYSGGGWGRAELPIAADLAQTNIALPCHPQLRKDEQAGVIAALRASPVGPGALVT